MSVFGLNSSLAGSHSGLTTPVHTFSCTHAAQGGNTTVTTPSKPSGMGCQARGAHSGVPSQRPPEKRPLRVGRGRENGRTGKNREKEEEGRGKKEGGRHAVKGRWGGSSPVRDPSNCHPMPFRCRGAGPGRGAGRRRHRAGWLGSAPPPSLRGVCHGEVERQAEAVSPGRQPLEVQGGAPTGRWGTRRAASNKSQVSTWRCATRCGGGFPRRPAMM